MPVSDTVRVTRIMSVADPWVVSRHHHNLDMLLEQTFTSHATPPSIYSELCIAQLALRW